MRRGAAAGSAPARRPVKACGEHLGAQARIRRLALLDERDPIATLVGDALNVDGVCVFVASEEDHVIT